MVKIAFQNVRTSNAEKIARLASALNEYDAIFLSEVDNPRIEQNCRIIAQGLFKFHYDPSTCRRIGMIATNLIDINKVENDTGLTLTQERVQKDQTALQTCLFEIKFKEKRQTRKIYVENLYAIPNLSNVNKGKSSES